MKVPILCRNQKQLIWWPPQAGARYLPETELDIAWLMEKTHTVLNVLSRYCQRHGTIACQLGQWAMGTAPETSTTVEGSRPLKEHSAQRDI